MPWLSDEWVEEWEDPTDRWSFLDHKKQLTRRRSQGRSAVVDVPVARGMHVTKQILSKHSWEDNTRKQQDRDVNRVFADATPGTNRLSVDEFRRLLAFAYPPGEMHAERRKARKTGRIQWGGGVVFACGRVTEDEAAA